MTEAYEDRKLSGKCTYTRGCAAPLAPGSLLCERHLASARESKRRFAMKARAARRARGLCAEPGCPNKSLTYRCITCAVKAGRQAGWKPANPGRVDGGVDSARRAAQTKKHADGRTRYHGKPRRGQPTRAQNDEQDLADALKAAAAGKAALVEIEKLRGSGLGQFEVKAARQAALSKVAMAKRFLEATLVRGGWEEPDPVTDEE